jgi:hypothetical protein
MGREADIYKESFGMCKSVLSSIDSNYVFRKGSEIIVVAVCSLWQKQS